MTRISSRRGWTLTVTREDLRAMPAPDRVTYRLDRLQADSAAQAQAVMSSGYRGCPAVTWTCRGPELNGVEISEAEARQIAAGADPVRVILGSSPIVAVPLTPAEIAASAPGGQR